MLGNFIQSSSGDALHNKEINREQLFFKVIDPLKTFLNHKDRRYRDFATHMIGDFAGAIHKYWKTQELKNIVNFILGHYSNTVNNVVGASVSEQKGWVGTLSSKVLLYKIGAGQLSLLVLAKYLRPSLCEDIDVGISNALNTVLKNIINNYPKTWSTRTIQQREDFLVLLSRAPRLGT